MNPFLFVANFKMNPVSPSEIEQYIQVLKRETEGKEWQHTKGVLCPSLLHIAYFHSLPESFFLGAQHGFPEKTGAYTGEVSYAMLKNSGVEYVVIGHSERRQYFGETNETVRIRTESALKFLLKPIVCIGETESELANGRREQVLTEQIASVLKGLSKMQAEKIIFAYEPRFAIGTGITPTTEDLKEVYSLIQRLLVQYLGETTAERVCVLYGGSVKAGNLEEVALSVGMNGVLVGKESLSPYEVVKMMDLAEKYKEEKLAY